MTSDSTERVEFVELTPSGISVLYSPAPKRLYMVQGAGLDEWTEVPSVTSVLGMLDKPGLSWWGMKVGIEGVQTLQQRGVYTLGSSVDEVVAQLTEHKLTVNHTLSKAGDRGVAVHDALEVWAKSGVLPDPTLFPVEQAGYVNGLLQFLTHVSSAEPVAAEVMVGSVEHGFAGRYDLRFRTTEEHQVCFKRTPKRGPQWATLKPGLFLCDLKSSKGIYPSHALQLEAYELASIECGYGETDGRGVLHVSGDGTYEFRRTTATADDFLAVRGVHRRFEKAKEWL